MTPTMAFRIPVGMRYSPLGRDHIKDVLDAAEAAGLRSSLVIDRLQWWTPEFSPSSWLERAPSMSCHR